MGEGFGVKDLAFRKQSRPVERSWGLRFTVWGFGLRGKSGAEEVTGRPGDPELDDTGVPHS